MGEVNYFLPLFQRLARGTATEEDRELYIKQYANDTERRLNKAYFEFTAEEELDFNIAEENLKEGDLHLTDGTGYNCRLCKNKGFIAGKRNGIYVECDCKCLTIRKTLRQAKWSGLGDIFKRCTLNTFNCQYQWQGLLKDKALEFISSASNCFYVGGTSGAGKSHICTAIVGALLKQGKDVDYVQWLDVVDELNNARYRQVEKYDEILNRIKNVEVLYIDDFLKGDNSVKPSSADIKFAYRIINARYVKSRAEGSKRYITIISSEWAQNQIVGFDEATGGRIKEMANGFVVRIEGKDKNRRFAEG